MECNVTSRAAIHAHGAAGVQLRVYRALYMRMLGLVAAAARTGYTHFASVFDCHGNPVFVSFFVFRPGIEACTEIQGDVNLKNIPDGKTLNLQVQKVTPSSDCKIPAAGDETSEAASPGIKK